MVKGPKLPEERKPKQEEKSGTKVKLTMLLRYLLLKDTLATKMLRVCWFSVKVEMVIILIGGKTV